MALIHKVLGGVLLFSVFASVVGKWMLWIAGVVAALFIIRLLADVFWFGKDEEWW
jgi:hypothetical protein